jgi:hypothetical protein
MNMLNLKNWINGYTAKEARMANDALSLHLQGCPITETQRAVVDKVLGGGPFRWLRKRPFKINWGLPPNGSGE